jgi:hypothetical protein
MTTDPPASPATASVAGDSMGPAVSLRPLLVAIVLAILINAAAAGMAPNRFIMAVWFVWKYWLLPVVLLQLGWFGYAIWFRPRSAARVAGLHFTILLLVCLALPLTLSVINLLPFGQTTSTWRGRVIAWERVSEFGESGSEIIVRSEDLGPFLRFRFSNLEVIGGVSLDLNPQPTVEGWAVRGFMGVPVAVRLKPKRNHSDAPEAGIP